MRDRFLFCFAPFALLWREWQLRSNFSWCSCFFSFDFYLIFFDRVTLLVYRIDWIFRGFPTYVGETKQKVDLKKKGQTIFFLNDELGDRPSLGRLGSGLALFLLLFSLKRRSDSWNRFGTRRLFFFCLSLGPEEETREEKGRARNAKEKRWDDEK